MGGAYDARIPVRIEVLNLVVLFGCEHHGVRMCLAVDAVVHPANAVRGAVTPEVGVLVQH